MGYILDGHYYKGKPAERLRRPVNSTLKQHEHNRQRLDHAKDIIQPYDRNGKPNQSFIEAYPTESKEVYHFLPDNEQLMKGQ
jgi:hypothetical protein